MNNTREEVLKVLKKKKTNADKTKMIYENADDHYLSLMFFGMSVGFETAIQLLEDEQFFINQKEILKKGEK